VGCGMYCIAEGDLAGRANAAAATNGGDVIINLGQGQRGDNQAASPTRIHTILSPS
jgi:hypothetical protein